MNTYNIIVFNIKFGIVVKDEFIFVLKLHYF